MDRNALLLIDIVKLVIRRNIIGTVRCFAQLKTLNDSRYVAFG